MRTAVQFALRLALVAIAVWLIGCAASRAAPSPDIPFEPALESLPVSSVALPIRISYAKLIQQSSVESRISRMEDHNDSWREVPSEGSGNGIKYKWVRDSIALSGTDSTLTFSTVVSFQAKYAHRIKQPWPFTNYTWLPLGSCGYDEPMPRVRLLLAISVSFDHNWKIRTRSQTRAEFLQPCAITIAGFDVSERIEEIVQENLERAAAALDDRLAESTQVEERARLLWDRLQKPMPIGEQQRLALLLHPQYLAAASPKFDSAGLALGLKLAARPEVVADSSDSLVAEPLPLLRMEPVDSNFSFRLRIQLDDSGASALLRDKLVGKDFKFPSGQRVIVRDVSVSGNSAKLVLRIRFAGQFDGELFFSGKPEYDSAAQRVRIPDFDYDLKTRDWLATAEDWMLHGAFVATIKPFVEWDLRKALLSARERLNEALNKEVADGVRLNGRVGEMRVDRLHRSQHGLFAIVVFSGSMQIDAR